MLGVGRPLESMGLQFGSELQGGISHATAHGHAECSVTSMTLTWPQSGSQSRERFPLTSSAYNLLLTSQMQQKIHLEP